jgi:hypothetical protein
VGYGYKKLNARPLNFCAKMQISICIQLPAKSIYTLFSASVALRENVETSTGFIGIFAKRRDFHNRIGSLDRNAA